MPHRINDSINQKVLYKPEMAQVDFGPERASETGWLQPHPEIDLGPIGRERQSAVPVVDVGEIHQHRVDQQHEDQQRHAEAEGFVFEKAGSTLALVRAGNEAG